MVKVLMQFQGKKRKKTMENSREVLLMEFQGVQFLKMDIINRGYGLFLEKPDASIGKKLFFNADNSLKVKREMHNKFVVLCILLFLLSGLSLARIIANSFLNSLITFIKKQNAQYSIFDIY